MTAPIQQASHAVHRSQASLQSNEVESKIEHERMKANLKEQRKQAEITFEVERDEQSGWLTASWDAPRGQGGITTQGKAGDGVKLPRDVSGGEAVRALRRLGFQVVRQEGSHIRMSKGAVRLTVPNHKTILPKTLQSVLRQAGVSVEQFLEAL